MTTIPERAFDLIKRWEGFRADWYDDIGGVPTIGYGTTAMDVAVDLDEISAPIDKETATTLLKRSIRQEYEPCVRESVTARVTDLQLGALVSLCYNIGCGAFGDSTLVQLLNAGYEEEAEDEFLRWKYVNGNVIEGLLNRRRAEKKLFEHDEEGAFAIETEPVPVARVERLGTPTIDELLSRIEINRHG